MFYVLYSPSHKQYLDEDRELCIYEQAEKFDRMDSYVTLENDIRWVGPCIEGEEP